VLSCAPTPRELAKMEQLLALLPARPWRVLAGKVNLTQLAAVIAHSTAHLCGDTGPLHLAVMTRTPMVAWFWPNPGRAEWVPNEGPLRVLSGTNPPGETFLAGIETDAIVAAVRELVGNLPGPR
jgi:ADP-heptose:LPS heptosyltransferase